MDMNTTKKDNVPESDTGNRHVGDIVPVTRGSSASKGLTSGSVASSEAKAVIASVEKLDSEITMRRAPLRTDEGDPPNSLSDEGEMMGVSSYRRMEFSDSEDPGPSGSSGILSRPGIMKSRKRKKRNSPPDEEIEEEKYGAGFNINNKKRVEGELAGLELEHASKINQKIGDMVDEIESIRRRSKNIKGSLSGQIKVFLEVIRRASSLLSLKATSNDNPNFWKAKYYGMEKESNENRCRIDALEARLREYEKKELLKNAYDNNTSEKEYVDRATSAPSASESEDRIAKGKKENWYSNNRKVNNNNVDKISIVSESMVCGSMERINLDRAMIHSLDRLGEGMTQLIKETRQMREALDSAGQGANFSGKGKQKKTPVNKSKGKNTYDTNKELLSNLKKRIPNTSAISILLDECEYSYSDILSKAREKISLSELGITDTRIKRAANRGVLIEIPGLESEIKADNLCSKMRELFFGVRGVSLRRPMKRVQLRLSGLDDSISTQEIKNMIAKEGSCDVLSVTCGMIRHIRGGMGVALAQCPITAAVKILERGRLVIGWSTVGVETLRARPLQCFRCLAVGHTVQRCPSTEDRRFNCYKCGQAQDNLTHLMDERNAALAVISEPNLVPEDNRWVTELNTPPKAAILWRRVKDKFSPMVKLHQGRGFCAVRWNDVVILSCYFSPNAPPPAFNDFLDDLYSVFDYTGFERPKIG
ncbi:uncharacterized protein [Linepithema humile]|uniref:uncharacterized protein n=1 Tax=Linepithema humile TaxID=83485 RepID=UPI00351E9B88